MKKFSWVVAVILATLLVACTPGDPGATTGGAPRATVASVFGNAAPGTIVGVVCTEDDADIARNKKCPAPASILVGPDGKYSVKVFEAVGHYDVYASLGGHRSERVDPRCSFSLNPGNQSGGLSDCPVYDINLTPVTLTYPSDLGLYNHGNTVVYPIFANSHFSNGVDVPGGRTVTAGTVFEWSKDSFSGLERVVLTYSLLHDVIFLKILYEDEFGGIISRLDEYGNIIDSGYAELQCGVEADIKIGAEWYYRCSRFGVTFNKTNGVISFIATPTYSYAPVLPNFPTDWETGRYSRWPLISGTLTFQPF